MISQRIKVGVFNWSEFADDGGFYPDDLPADWRLSYYSNEFETACLHLAAPGLDGETIAAWLEDLPDSFELSFALSAASQIETILELIKPRALSLQWLIIDDSDGQPRTADLQRELEQHSAELAAAGLGPGAWRQRKQIWTPAHAHISSELAMLPPTESLAGYRGWIEQWLENAPANEAASLTLWCTADTGYPRLGEMRSLLELMGY